jgi:HSP20 family protein
MRLIRYKTPTYTPSNYPSLLDEMDRLFDAAFPAPGSGPRGNGGQFPIDLYQDKDAFTVRAELPGFRREDLSIDLADGVLTIAGQQKTEAKADDKETAPVAQERRVSRAVSLPENVDVEKIAAAYENGVLTVTLPKREETKPRQITINVK